MFGKNQIVKQEKTFNGSIRIKEIFYTLEGEAFAAGEPCTFIRFADCNLNCSFCDTDFSTNVRAMSIANILRQVEEVRHKDCRLVSITGGEAFVQAGLSQLVRKLLANNFDVIIETNGTLWQNEMNDIADNPKLHICCSPKTAKINRSLIPHISHYKYIIKAGETRKIDGLPNVSALTGNEVLLARPEGAWPVVYLQPMDEQDEEKNKTNLLWARDLCLEHCFRLSVQVHKIAEVP
jgi:7-carboxy-7-deazaguanine synthase